MTHEGLLQEAQSLRDCYGKELPLLQTMNYKQAGAVLGGLMTEQQAVEEMIKVNMRYAHRQMSWWKRNKEIEWFSSPEEVLETWKLPPS